MPTTFDISEILGSSVIRILITILVAILLQSILHRTVERLVRQAIRSKNYDSKIEEKKRENTLTSIFSTLTAVMLWLIVGLIILADLGVNIAALATGAGLIGILVGFGAQSLVKDYLAGILIILEDQYRVGDVVSFSADGNGDVAGVVEDITIRVTRLRDLDGKLHIVSNGMTGVITNMTYKFAQINVDVGVSYDSDIDEVERVINKVGADMTKDDEWAAKIIEPISFLRVDNFADSSITVKSLGKVNPADQWEVAGEFRRRLKKAFDKHDIEIPFPQVVVHQPKSK